MAFYLEIGQIFGYVIKGWIKSRNRGGREVEGEVSEKRMGQSAISNFFFFFFFFSIKKLSDDVKQRRWFNCTAVQRQVPVNNKMEEARYVNEDFY